MDYGMRQIGSAAKGLSRNPLGIIALFIVFAYGVAGLVTGLGSPLTSSQKSELVHFLVFFPVLIFFGFCFLVMYYHEHLYTPDEVGRDRFGEGTERNKKQDTAAVDQFVSSFRKSDSYGNWKSNPQILWINDRPSLWTIELQICKKLDINCTIVASTSVALQMVANQEFDVVVSDMTRDEGDPSETEEAGFRLLRRIRPEVNTPYLIYTDQRCATAVAKAKTLELSGQGCTASRVELFKHIGESLKKNGSPERSGPPTLQETIQ